MHVALSTFDADGLLVTAGETFPDDHPIPAAEPERFRHEPDPTPDPEPEAKPPAKKAAAKTTKAGE